MCAFKKQWNLYQRRRKKNQVQCRFVLWCLVRIRDWSGRQFNDVLTEYVVKTLNVFLGKKHIWVVGERIRVRLESAGLPLAGFYEVPSSINAITPFGVRVLIDSEKYRRKNKNVQFYIFYNRPKSGAIY